jgi:hypothetical protein
MGVFAVHEIEGLFVAFEGLMYVLEADAVDGHLRRWSGSAFARVIDKID